MPIPEYQSPFQQMGGEETIAKLVEAFYPRVIRDPDLSPLFVDGIEEIMRKQKMFLTQFLGGPPLFSEEFGPPAMRARHLRFPVTPRRAQAWLSCMEKAMDDIQLEDHFKEDLYRRLAHVAYLMINTPDEPSLS